MFFTKLVGMSLLATLALSTPTLAEGVGCANTMKAKFGMVTPERTLVFGGDATVLLCDGITVTMHEETVPSFEAADVFSQSGYDFFSMNVEFIALNLGPPVPEEYRPDGTPFLIFPEPDTITPDRSDLALGLNGAADTVVFRITEESPVMFLQFYETSGMWFGQPSYGDS